MCNDLIFLSLSNMSTNTQSNNIITMGINLESQLLAIKDFIEKQKEKRLFSILIMNIPNM